MPTRGKSPRSIPRTQQDVERAYDRGYKDGYSVGITGGLTVMLYTLQDKFGADDDQLKAFSDAFNYTVDSIDKEYVKLSDLKSVMKKEYGTTFEFATENPDPLEGAGRGT